VHETIKENPGIPVKRACNQVGEQLGIPGSTLRNWLRAPGPVPGRRRRRPTRMRGSCSWRGRTGNCAARTRSWGRPRLSSRRSSTAPHHADRLHRPAQGPFRGRADLHRPDPGRRSDRPEHLLRGEDAPALAAGAGRRSVGWAIGSARYL